MKPILKGIAIIVMALVGLVVALVVLAFALNYLVRVSHSPTRSIGIVEEWLFGRPMEEALAPPGSEDYKRWDSASKASASVAELLQEFGAQDLTMREDLAKQRTQAEHLSKVAFESASAVPRAYLADSNADLPDAYFTYFVPAMDSWRHGFADKNLAAVQEGISNYNAFLMWMQLHDRNDFKPIR